MNVAHAPIHRRPSIWRYDVENPVYDHACTAMATRPDFPEIERLWAAIDERFKFMKYDYTVDDDNHLYEFDLSELSDEIDCSDDVVVSHLRTLHGAGMILALTFFQEFNSVSIVASPHVVAK